MALPMPKAPATTQSRNPHPDGRPGGDVDGRRLHSGVGLGVSGGRTARGARSFAQGRQATMPIGETRASAGSQRCCCVLTRPSPIDSGNCGRGSCRD